MSDWKKAFDLSALKMSVVLVIIIYGLFLAVGTLEFYLQ